jgi:single-stranded-DNA-specific exonuclease
LVGLNRAFVAQGLKVAALRANPGLAALADKARIAERIDAYHLGYVLGPRVNAGGRVGRADLGARLLSTDDAAEAARLAQSLDEFNAERRGIEAEVLADAIQKVEAGAAFGSQAAIVVAGEAWHQGVIGIVAARLRERYDRPACVVTWDGGDGGKGSGRSVAGFDLGAAVIAARQSGLLAGGGGHKMAAGFTLTRRNLEPFAEFLSARAGGASGGRPAPELGVDGLLSAEAATADFVELLAKLGPFGAGNAEPRFALPNLRVSHAAVVGEAHVRCALSSSGGASVQAIAFRSLETELGQTLLRRDRPALHVAGHLRLDSYRGGKTCQLFIDDAALAHES